MVGDGVWSCSGDGYYLVVAAKLNCDSGLRSTTALQCSLGLIEEACGSRQRVEVERSVAKAVWPVNAREKGTWTEFLLLCFWL